MSELLIKNGTIVSSESIFDGDILIKEGKIEKIAPKYINKEKTKEIDAKGKYVFPGGIDVHVHMDLPTEAGKSSDDFESGSKAALYGGTTTLIDFVTPEYGQSYIEALNKRKEEAQKCIIDYSLHMSPSWWSPNSSIEIKKFIHEEGINSFKVYMAYKNAIGINDDEILQLMKIVANHNGLVTLHCEYGEIIDFHRNDLIMNSKTSVKNHPISRSSETESQAVYRAIMMSKVTNCKIYIVHVSSKKSIELIAQARKENLKVFAETCPHYLLFDDEVYNNSFEKSAPYVLSPPIRKKSDQIALWNAIKMNDIQTIATDHCPFNLNGQKDRGKDDFTKIPNGAGSVEHRMSLLFTYGVLNNKISLNEFVRITSSNPAEIFGLSHLKGDIKEGLDADLIIWNPDKENIISSNIHHQNCDHNIYDGFKTIGESQIVIKNGEVVLEDAKIKNNPKGKFLKRVLK